MGFKRLTAVLLSLALVSGCACALAVMPPCDDTVLDGIDVSVFQGDIDFARVKSAGIDTVYIRAGEGGNITDTNFEQNYARASAAGLQIGFYYVCAAASASEAVYQAGRFAALIAGKRYDARPAMDFDRLSGVTKAQANAIALAFLRRLEALTGETPALYSDAYATETLWEAPLSAYPLWVADYNAGGVPDSPVFSCWAGRQYSSRGRVDGIAGDVDMDTFNKAILLPVTPTPTPVPTPTPTPTPVPTPTPCFIAYTVRPGDTLTRIAQSFGVTVNELVLWNNIANPNLIRTGQVLRIYR